MDWQLIYLDSLKCIENFVKYVIGPMILPEVSGDKIRDLSKRISPEELILA